jgi:hypothetical protein
MKGVWSAIVRWWRRNIVSDDPWYDWADQRLDEIEREKRQR